MKSNLHVDTGNLIRAERLESSSELNEWKGAGTESVSVRLCVCTYIHSSSGPLPKNNELKIPSGALKVDPVSLRA